MKKKTIVRKEKPQTYAKTGTEEQTRDDIYRELTSGNTAEQPVYTIRREDKPLDVHSFLPDYRYRFEGSDTHSGDAFLEEFAQFLAANEYLVLDEMPTRAFADGFAQAVAVAALYMDSLDIALSRKAK